MRRRLYIAATAIAVYANCAAAGALAAGERNPAGSAAPSGYIGKGQMVVQTSLGGAGNKLTVGGDVALETRESKLRLDVLSLAIPGANATVSALVGTQLFPPGGFSIVYDRTNASYTVWSNAKRNYYTSAVTNVAPSGATATSTAVALSTAGDLFGAFAPARGLKDATAFAVSLALAGHGTINGHPATAVDYSYARTLKSGDALDVHGRLQLADDLDAVPVQITASLKSTSIPESALRLDLTTLAKQTPPREDFSVPPGYVRTSDLGDVVGKDLPL